MVIGFLLAYLLMKIPRFNNLYVSVLMIPMMITPIAIGLIWRLLLHPDLGIVNYLLNLIGIGGKAWLGLKSTALGTIVFVETWRSTPYVMLILYAALLSLPTEPYEAATIDGASELQKIRYLTIPMLRPVLVVVSTLQLIYLFKTYDLVYILTRGGPGISTETLSYFIFRQGFTNVDMGNASAASYLIVVIVSLATTFLFFRLRGRKITR
jgi:multiple sugar transport system permease protein